MDDPQKTLRVTVETGGRGGRGRKKNAKGRGSAARSKTDAASQEALNIPTVLEGTMSPKLPIDKLSRLLSARNLDLLRMIKTAQPESVAELARLSGRPKASLTLTLRRLEKFGIVVFKTASGRRKIPTVVCDRLMLEVAIVP